MKSYKKKFQTFWIFNDHKAKGKDKQAIEASVRMDAKEEIQAIMLEEAMIAAEGPNFSEEIEESLDCHYGHRACEKCGKRRRLMT